MVKLVKVLRYDPIRGRGEFEDSDGKKEKFSYRQFNGKMFLGLAFKDHFFLTPAKGFKHQIVWRYKQWLSKLLTSKNS